MLKSDVVINDVGNQSDAVQPVGSQPSAFPIRGDNSKKRIAIIGGGLTGLSAAHRLNELLGDQAGSVEIVLFESGPRLGGLVGTQRIGEYLIDVGADSFLTNKPAAVNLCRRLGIEDRLIPTDSRFRGALVLRDGRPVPVPEGFQLLSPTAIWPVLTSPIFSVWGKLRLLMEWFIPRRTILGSIPQTITCEQSAGLIDESLTDFVRRRFGSEALDRLIQPLVGGIYTADPTRLSLAATLPRFLEMERDCGSLIKASLLQSSKRKLPNDNSDSDPIETTNHRDLSSGARYGLFAGLKGGMDDLVNALRIDAESFCTIHTNSQVVSVTATDNLNSRGFELKFADDHHEQFAGVIVAISGTYTARILKTLDTRLSDELQKIEYASSVIVVSGHRLADIRDPLKAFGLVIPHLEHRKILAVSFSSRKFPDRAPKDRVLLRTFVGGAMQPQFIQQSDDEIIEMVRNELAETLGVHGEPDFVQVYRYPHAMPQYHVGHLDLVRRIEDLARPYSGLELAGISCRGVGIPDAIASGERAAEEVLASFALTAAGAPSGVSPGILS